MAAVAAIPVQDLNGKVIGSQVRLANGSQRWSLIGNVDTMNPQFTEHFLTLSVENDGKWFHLARYHHHDYVDREPEALSRFRGLEIYDVFPIAYDFRGYVEGDLTALVGAIPAGNTAKAFAVRSRRYGSPVDQMVGLPNRVAH